MEPEVTTFWKDTLIESDQDTKDTPKSICCFGIYLDYNSRIDIML